jgi:hypothetical protein
MPLFLNGALTRSGPATRSGLGAIAAPKSQVESMIAC